MLLRAPKASFALFALHIALCRSSDDWERARESTPLDDILGAAEFERVEVFYEDTYVDFGNELLPAQVREPPAHVHWHADEDSLQSVLLLDLDAPRRENPHARCWLHWLVVNVPAQDVARGQVLAEYVGAAPGRGTGFHRYVFVVLLQTGYVNFRERLLTKTSGKGRASFSLVTFCERYLLYPSHANFFYAQWDPSVPLLEQQLRGE